MKSLNIAGIALIVLVLTGFGARQYSQRFHFPAGFIWGAASSSHQVEGGNTNNDWHEWEKAGKTRDESGLATDHYHRYAEDLALAQGMRHNAFRLSIEWSRIEPKQGAFSDAELDHYKDVLQTARSRGLKTVITLHHFTNPIWLAKLGGWQNPAIIELFASYTRVVVEKLGDYVDYWLTVNEPNVNALTSYAVGATPPGEQNFARVVPALANFLKAHARAYHVIHKTYPHALVSFAHHVRVFHASRGWHPGDALIAGVIDQFWNHRPIEALKTGNLNLTVPFIATYQENVPELKGTLDYIGLNYYTRDLIEMDLSLPQKFSIRLPPKNSAKSDMGWEIYPEGLYDLLQSMRRYKLPIIITENGLADANDSLRPSFLCSHLKQIARAMGDGIDIRGYLHWALTDNFEWIDGFTPRFGLVAIDYAAQTRTVRPSAKLYTEIIKSGTLDSCR